MVRRLEDVFHGVASPTADQPTKAIYAVRPIPGYESYFVGKDRDSHACLLVATADQAGRLASPIRLENLDVQFELRCQLRQSGEPERTGAFTVVRCRSLDDETVRYFLSVCDTIVGILGDKPKQRDVATAVHRLASIFQKLQKLPTRPVSGLFGELYLISRSACPPRATEAWRADDTARFDFAFENARIDVKAASGRLRAHTFSYEQCTPPPGTVAVVASLLVEQSSGGITLRSLVSEIEVSIAAYPDLVLKLREVVAATLGTGLIEALAISFDAKLAESSLCFYDLRKIPAIREPLPNGVSDVHFRSDLSLLEAESPSSLIERELIFGDLLPADCL
jgi:hypothetical protein